MNLKLFIFLILLNALSCCTHAQGNKNMTLVGFQKGVVSINYDARMAGKKIKIGIPTFSYAASIEKRFSLHNKLNFSFQYSMNYYRQMKSTIDEINSYQQHPISTFGSSIHLNTLYEIRKNTSLVAGLGVGKTAANYFTKNKQETNVKNKMFSMQDFNPSLMIGIENSTRIFNKSLYYSLQYNFGFFPSSQSYRTENVESITPTRLQGVQFGLKYKY